MSFSLSRVVVWFLIATLAVGCFMSNVGKWRRVTKLIMNAESCSVHVTKLLFSVVLVFMSVERERGFRSLIKRLCFFVGRGKNRHGETLLV